jgi:hypothetical protein
MGNNLTGQLISATYEQLVQISGSILTDGTGSNITSVTVTASYARSFICFTANSAHTSYFSILRFNSLMLLTYQILPHLQ